MSNKVSWNICLEGAFDTFLKERMKDLKEMNFNSFKIRETDLCTFSLSLNSKKAIKLNNEYLYEELIYWEYISILYPNLVFQIEEEIEYNNRYSCTKLYLVKEGKVTNKIDLGAIVSAVLSTELV